MLQHGSMLYCYRAKTFNCNCVGRCSALIQRCFWGITPQRTANNAKYEQIFISLPKVPFRQNSRALCVRAGNSTEMRTNIWPKHWCIYWAYTQCTSRVPARRSLVVAQKILWSVVSAANEALAPNGWGPSSWIFSIF